MKQAQEGKRGKVRGRVGASVPCIVTMEGDVSCVGDMTLEGGYKDGSYITLTLRGDYKGVKLECTSQGSQLACPIRIGTTVVAQGRLDFEPEHSFHVLHVESLCLD